MGGRGETVMDDRTALTPMAEIKRLTTRLDLYLSRQNGGSLLYRLIGKANPSFCFRKASRRARNPTREWRRLSSG
jgi:hypothetical protein